MDGINSKLETIFISILGNNLDRLLQDVESGLDLFFRDGQGGDEAKTTVSSRDDEHASLARSGDQVRSLGDIGFGELDTEDETAAADVGDDVGVFLLEGLEAGCEEGGFGFDGFLEVRGCEALDDVVGNAAGEGVSAEGGAVVAGLDVLADSLLGDDGSADGEAVAQGLCGGEDVRVSGLAGGRGEGRVAVGPEAACARETTLDLVEDQNSADGIAAFAEGNEELWSGAVDTALSLNGLDNNTACLVRDKGLELFDVVEVAVLEPGNHW